MNKQNRLSGRESFLVSQALYIAARALRAQEHPPLADIEEMNELLDAHFPTHKKLYQTQTNMQLALRLGYQPKVGEIREAEVEQWIVEHLPDDDRSPINMQRRRLERDEVSEQQY